MALAVLVLPFPLPLTCVEVYRPVTSEVSTKRSATFEVLIVVDMMLCQTPVGMVCEPCATHGARLLEFAQTVTVVICAVAFELCAETKLEQQSKAAVRLMSSFFMRQVYLPRFYKKLTRSLVGVHTFRCFRSRRTKACGHLQKPATSFPKSRGKGHQRCFRQS